MSDAVNTEGDLQFEYPNWKVTIDGDEAENINPKGELFEFEPEQIDPVQAIDIGLDATTVYQSAGGQSLDRCDLEWALSGHLVDREQPPDFTKAVEVKLPDDNDTRIHWGDYVTETETVEAKESLTAESHLRAYHFGDPFKGQTWYDTVSGDDIETGYPPIFNPLDDNEVLPNRSDWTKVGGNSLLWIHPQAARTEDAEEFSTQVASEWDLESAVEAMCESCNMAEEFIQNPVASTYKTILEDAPKLSDVKLPLGQHLPFYLDRLLHPLGFNWFVDYEVEGKPQITLFEKGVAVGETKSLRFQEPGEVLDAELTNLKQYRIRRGIGDSVNAVTVLGGLQAREVTLPLWPAWPETGDAGTAAMYSKGGTHYEGDEHYLRKWVANEAGDYTNVRSDDAQAVVPDLSHVFDAYVPHRRKPEEPLTHMGSLQDDRKSKRPFRVDYCIDAGEVDEEGEWSGTWAELPDAIAGNLLLLPDEIGVYFNSDAPPEAIMDELPDVRLRLTCVIEGDSRIKGEAERQNAAVNGRTVPLVLDKPHKFQDRQVLTEGKYLSVLHSPQTTARERDDAEEIQDFAEELRDLYEVAEIDAGFRLPGWHLEYKIGDLLDEITGRNISLNQSSSGERYVQITGRQFVKSNAGVWTVLIVDRGVRRRG